ncbi:hsp70-binding protein 1-like [Mercenaria mercenaria]|uniref:hsp70-binding protein 1-like n=1 Tax=Mercenaria mercenaria TaxID=6596 RepID=UPI00234EFB6D|nr:hsp70-binding protein 1-like [Mercenaria mercenaria]
MRLEFCFVNQNLGEFQFHCCSPPQTEPCLFIGFYSNFTHFVVSYSDIFSLCIFVYVLLSYHIYSDFHKIGGFRIFTQCLESEEPEIRRSCLDVIASLVQNNPYCQAAVLQHDLLPTILHMLDTDNNSTVKVKALYAVSCLIRDCEEGLDGFLSHDGFSVIMRAMQTDIDKLKIKSAFMLSSICSDNNKCKDIVCDIGMIDQLVGHLSEEHSSFHEHLLSALLSIVRGHPRSLQQCSRPELNLLSLLQQKEQDMKGKDEFQEEYEYTVELLKLLKTSQDSSEQDVVR